MNSVSAILYTLKKQSQFILKSEGTSMLPFLHPEDVLFYKKTRYKNIGVNDFICMRKGKRIFTHRVIYKNARYIVTRGDNNIHSDGKILPKMILGKVYQIKRKGQILSPEDLYLFQSTIYLNELVNITRTFMAVSIRFVFLKGLPLHLFYDEGHPRRLYADCDILIDKKDWVRTLQILKTLQYKKSDASFSNIHRVLKDKITEVSYYKYIHNIPVVLDLHIEAGFLMNQLGRLDALYPQVLIDQLTQRFLQEKKFMVIHSHPFPILSPADIILYLALHFYHHNYRGMFRIEFLKTVLLKHRKRPALYSEISTVIRDFHLEGFTYPVFLMLGKYYNVTMPRDFIERIHPRRSQFEYTQRLINTVSPFDDESQFHAGIVRFKNLFFLSPLPLHEKMRIIFNLQVIYSFLWAMIRFVHKSLLLTLRTNFHTMDS